MEENLNPDPTNVNPEQNPKPKSNKGLFIVIALMAIIIAGLVGYVVYTDSQEKGEKDSTSSSKEVESEKNTDEDEDEEKESKTDKKKSSKDEDEDEDDEDKNSTSKNESKKSTSKKDDESDEDEKVDEEDEEDEEKKSDTKTGFGKKDKTTTDNKNTTESKNNVKEETKDDSKQESKETTTTTAPASGDWKSAEFTFDGKSYKINDDYTKFKANGWYVDMAKAGYEDGYILNKNQKVYSTVSFLNDNFKDANVRVGFINLGEKAVDITETQIWAITVDNKYSDTPVNFTLPGGIKNGSTLAEVEAAYGKPTDEDDIYRSEDLGYTTYTYDNDLEPELRLTIWDEGGLTKFEYKIY